MANGNKKSSRPDLLGIHRKMLEAGQDTRAASFVGGAMEAFKLNLLEEEKAKATLEQHMENLGGVVNINKLSEEQRGPVTEFLKQGRDDYYALATEYAKTKDPATKDKMDAIKYSFQTLNSQLAQYATGKAEYLSDYEDGNLIGGEGFAAENSFYTKIYGDPNAQFAIDQTTGEMSFTANGVTKNLKDIDGHTIRFYEGETAIDKYVQMGKEAKMTGANWMGAETTAKNFVNAFRGTNKNDIKALMYTDLSGDESDLSFIQQFKSGTLKDKSFYNGIKMNQNGTVAEEEISRILNSKKLSLDLLGKFVGNVSDMSYNNAAVNPDVALKQEYTRLQNETMRASINKKKQSSQQGENVLNSGFQIQNRSLSKEVGNNLIYEIQNKGVARNPIDGMEYYWKGDGWYDGDNKKVADDTDQLTRDIFGIQDNRFNGLTPGAYNENEEDDTWKSIYKGGDDTTSDNLNKKYGLTSGNENIIFMPYTAAAENNTFATALFGQGWRTRFDDNIWTNDLIAYNPITEEIYRDDNDDPYRFMSRNSSRFSEEGAKEELKIIQDLIRKAGVNVPGGSGPIVINNQQGGRN